MSSFRSFLNRRGQAPPRPTKAGRKEDDADRKKELPETENSGKQMHSQRVARCKTHDGGLRHGSFSPPPLGNQQRGFLLSSPSRKRTEDDFIGEVLGRTRSERAPGCVPSLQRSLSETFRERVTILPHSPVRTSGSSVTLAPGDGLPPVRYLLGRVLGSGNYGTVHVCTSVETGRKLACKVVRKSLLGLNKQARERVHAEAAVLRHMAGHPNVLQLVDAHENRRAFYLFTELCDQGTLQEYLSLHGPLPEDVTASLFFQLASAVHHCYQRGILHRDLKPENIFLQSTEMCADDELAWIGRGEDTHGSLPWAGQPERQSGFVFEELMASTRKRVGQGIACDSAGSSVEEGTPSGVVRPSCDSSSSSSSGSSDCSPGSPQLVALRSGRDLGKAGISPGPPLLRVKLADFGSALPLPPGSNTSGMAGSRLYMAPEKISGRRKSADLQEKEQERVSGSQVRLECKVNNANRPKSTEYGHPSEVWSLGVILYAMLTGDLPFGPALGEGNEEQQGQGQIWESDGWCCLSHEAQSLIRSMLHSEADKRPTPGEILRHPWMQRKRAEKETEAEEREREKEPHGNCPLSREMGT